MDVPNEQKLLREDVDWIPQPAFSKAFADLTGAKPSTEEWVRQVNWNFTADDLSFT